MHMNAAEANIQPAACDAKRRKMFPFHELSHPFQSTLCCNNNWVICQFIYNIFVIFFKHTERVHPHRLTLMLHAPAALSVTMFGISTVICYVLEGERVRFKTLLRLVSSHLFLKLQYVEIKSLTGDGSFVLFNSAWVSSSNRIWTPIS